MATSRQRSKSGGSLPSESTTNDSLRQIRECIIRNDKLAKKIQNSNAKLPFKCDVEIRRLEKMIESAIKRLNQMKQSAESDLKILTKFRQEELPAHLNRCKQRALDLSKILDNADWLSVDSITSILNGMDTMMDETQHLLLGYTSFKVQANRSDICRNAFLNRNPFHVTSSFLLPSEVTLAFVTSRHSDQPNSSIITIKAEPKYETDSLQTSLKATLEIVDSGSTSGVGQAIIGIITPLNDSGAVTITFMSVIPNRDYAAKVTMGGQQIENSPMIVRHDVSPKSEAKLEFPDPWASQPGPFKSIAVSSNAFDFDFDNVFASPSSPSFAKSALKMLAGRARCRSGSHSGRIGSDPAPVAVAPKGILMGIGARHKRRRADSSS